MTRGGGRGVPQPCNPDTLNRVCNDCGRTCHRRIGRRGLRTKCDQGHLTINYHGLCTCCTSRRNRRNDGIDARATPQARPAWLYCTHDEGEPCDCEAAS